MLTGIALVALGAGGPGFESRRPDTAKLRPFFASWWAAEMHLGDPAAFDGGCELVEYLRDVLQTSSNEECACHEGTIHKDEPYANDPLQPGHGGSLSEFAASLERSSQARLKRAGGSRNCSS